MLCSDVLCVAVQTAEDVAERVLADDTVLDNEVSRMRCNMINAYSNLTIVDVPSRFCCCRGSKVAVRYFLRLIVQDGEGETFFVTSVSSGVFLLKCPP